MKPTDRIIYERGYGPSDGDSHVERVEPMTKDEAVAVKVSPGNITASSFAISARDGRRLLTIDLTDGSVVGSIEDASEAGRVFVESIRGHITRTPPASEPIIETCDHGHKFAYLPDHPRRNGLTRCPHCMAIGLDRLREPASEPSEADELRKERDALLQKPIDLAKMDSIDEEVTDRMIAYYWWQEAQDARAALKAQSTEQPTPKSS